MASQDSQFSCCPEPIAIIGTGLRLPGSCSNPSALWDLLLEPRDLLSRIPEDRFNSEAFYHSNPDRHGSTNVRGSYFLDQDIRQFDANFFNIKPKEAHAIDPQQRMLLEVVYEALEAAGLSIQAMAGSQTGVYVGLMCSDYTDQLHRDIGSMPTYTGTGTSRGITSNRISYFFDWHGPSMTIDTACSSSLVAVHQAVELLRSGDSDVAVAAGANLLLGPFQFMEFSKLHMLSPESRCNMWDQDASGYARGEGIAAVVLKRLSSAIADGDHIECVIRESGVNQDGRTKGITMPSSSAQADLITRTYARAGLDPRNPEDRCQYFEAHGTGTQAGDPREAEAISSSFFNPGEVVGHQGRHPLYVGSIKTVFGHTEGTAGLAGLIKTSLLLQHGIIPPNYGFNKLSPAVEPFYTNLEILKSAQDWPDIPEGSPRRASVNSFGFGGTNAHVILENFVASPKRHQQQYSESCRQLTPFNFSAASETSLKELLAGYLSHLQNHPETNLKDLSYTLHSRRSDHGSRIAISARSISDLITKISSILANDNKRTCIQTRILSHRHRILGIFTGQGAQWAGMGKELVVNIPQMQETIQDMDAILQSLPAPERPSWSLLDELLRDAETSRISTAVIGQPLCTMVQLLLCDLLSTAGIKFESVVGHSGGEVAAAYAAGIIGREDALKIAYFRGLITDRNPPSLPGGMMAIGTSVEQAYELCDMLGGRVEVAAINSPSSITIAGDLDAINEGKEILDAEKKFARVLKVDKAYHSRHMVPAGKTYADALKSTGIKVQSPRDNYPVWHSSVFENRVMGADGDLEAQYWTDNMIRPVLFSHALACATENTKFDLAIEVGPHPTLKGPALQTLLPDLPYTGVLSRNKDDIEAFSDSLGYIWSHLPPSIIDFGRCDSLVDGSKPPKLLTGLPTYPWDHQTAFWHSSRASNAFLYPRYQPNPLLGSWLTDVVDGEMRWKNLLQPNELPWIRDHNLQGQIVFPAAAYLSAAIEAAQALVPKEEHITMIEIEDFIITKPLVFKESDSVIETFFTLSDIVHNKKDRNFAASFRYHAGSSNDNCIPSNHAAGRIVVTVGELSLDLLPEIAACPPNTVSVCEEHFYASLASLGYNYSGSFKSASSIRRKLDFASMIVTVPSQDEGPDRMLLHPGLLESALQGMLLAYSYPRDGSLEELYVLNGVERFCVNVQLCSQSLLSDRDLLACAHLTAGSSVWNQLSGDVDIYSIDGKGLIQFECVQLVPLVGPTPYNDRHLFAEQRWDLASPNAQLAMCGAKATKEDHELAIAIERVCLHYMIQTLTEFPASIRPDLNLPWHFACLFDFFSYMVDTARNGTRRWVDPEWFADTDEDIAILKRRYADCVDVRLVCAVGDNLSSVLRRETTMLEHMTKDNLLDQFYAEGLGMMEYSNYVARTVKQLTHRYGRMNILEIGAGTGGATKLIMKSIQRSFSSYTYTDISTGFFETAQRFFSSSADKMIFKTLNVENDIISQGFEDHSYDLIVASLVLHATADLNRTLSNVRRLLKPGGYLIMTEISDNDVSRFGFMMCAMPGWWLGQNEGRTLSPCIPTSQWHELLQRNRFNGVDTSTPDLSGMPYPLTVIVSQAVDEKTEGLAASATQQSWKVVVDSGSEVVLIGGRTEMTASLIEEIMQILEKAGVRHTVFKSLADANHLKETGKSTALVLEEFDRLMSDTPLEEAYLGFKDLCSSQDTILLVRPIDIAREPHKSTTIGITGALTASNDGGSTIQLLEVDAAMQPTAQQLLRTLLSLYHSYELGKAESSLDILWTNEPQLAFKDNQTLVPRIYYNSDMNRRFNATRRTIYQPIHCQSTTLELILGPGATYDLVMSNAIDNTKTSFEASAASNDTLINVSHSIMNTMFGTVSSAAYLVIGTDTTTNVTTVAISSSNSSRVMVPKNKSTIVRGLPEEDRPRFLAQFYSQMQVECILATCTEGSVLLLHEPDHELAASIKESTARRDITVIFTTCSMVLDHDTTWIKLAPYASKRQILSSLPSNVSVFIDCSTSATAKKTGSLIASLFSDTCVETSQFETCITENVSLCSAALLTDACQKTLGKITSSHEIRLAVTDVNGVVGQSISDFVIPTIIDWKESTTVSIPVLPIESEIAFRADRTYALFHFPAELSQSLCDWMFKHGAQNIVVTSLDHIDERWLRFVRSSGLNVKLVGDTIADKQTLVSLVNDLQKEWPPIAGVGYGGMLMQQDVMLSDFSAGPLTWKLNKMVQEAQNLDETFRYSAAELDFFVLFSSLTPFPCQRGKSIGGRAGPFIAEIVRQRREKGLAASILHLGDVVGLRTCTHHYSVQDTLVEKTTTQGLSERVFHICFAEAIVASHPLCRRIHEIIAGLPRMFPEDNDRWFEDPRFQHIVRTEESRKSPIKAQTVSVSTKMRLLHAQTSDDVLEIVTGAFFTKLKACLQLSADHDKSRVLSSGVDELGIDSLVAVEICSWFLQHIDVDVSVFKILAGDTIAQLVRDVVLDLPSHLTPGVYKSPSESGVGIDADNVVEDKNSSSMGERSTTISVLSSTSHSDQGDEQGEATDTSVSERSFGKP